MRTGVPPPSASPGGPVPLASTPTHPGSSGTLPAPLNSAPGLWPCPLSAGPLQLADLRKVLALCSSELRGPGRGAQGFPSQACHLPPALAQNSLQGGRCGIPRPLSRHGGEPPQGSVWSRAGTSNEQWVFEALMGTSVHFSRHLGWVSERKRENSLTDQASTLGRGEGQQQKSYVRR